MSMNDIINGAPAPLPMPWNQLRAWIDEQEALERESNHPAPLTKIQLTSLSNLVSFIDDEPELSGEDYVSRLVHRTQAMGLPAPVYTDLKPLEVPVEGAIVQRWCTICTLPWCGFHTPCEGFGFDSGQSRPAFKSKKNSKQFAAKQALAFMSGTNSQQPPQASPSSTIRTAQNMFTNPNEASSFSPLRVSASTTSIAGFSNAPPLHHRAQPTPPIPPTPAASLRGGGNDNGNDESTVFARVAALTGRLGFDNPTYVIEEEPDRLCFFRGRPIFRNGGQIPPDVGVVSMVLGRRQAKEQVAEAVLRWLTEEMRYRDELKADLLQGFA